MQVVMCKWSSGGHVLVVIRRWSYAGGHVRATKATVEMPHPLDYRNDSTLLHSLMTNDQWPLLLRGQHLGVGRLAYNDR